MQSIFLDLGNNRNLVAELNPDSEFKEITIYLADDNGLPIQDLALVREAYKIKDSVHNTSEIVPVHNKYEVLVWADNELEDYTNSFTIEEYEELSEE